MGTPKLLMVAGPNGSGKSTLIAALRADPVFSQEIPSIYVNADDLQRERSVDTTAAQRAATQLRRQALAERRDVMYETVMSHPGKLAELQLARAAGYEMYVFFLATEDPSINVERIRLRVAAGGHDVPEDRTRQRYERTLAFAPVALSMADQALVYDNSVASRGMELQAQRVGDRLHLMTSRPAKWVEMLVARVNERAQELERLTSEGQGREANLHQARLDEGETMGPLAVLGQHYVLQRHSTARVLVLHDRALLPADLPLELGRSYRIGYREGVGTVAAVSG